MPLSVFIRCLCDNDLSAMLIDGEAAGDVLSEAWQNIYNEYLDLTAKNGNNEVLTLLQEFDSFFYKHAVIENTVTILRLYYEQDLINILKGYGYHFQFNPEDPEKYHKDLDSVMQRSKRMILEMEIRRKQIESLQKANLGAVINRQYFDEILVTLSKFSGYHVNEDLVTVSRYCAILNLYISHCKQLTAAQNVRSHR